MHVWWIDVPRWTSRVPRLRRVLAADERARASRLRFPGDADRFVIGRGVLRLLLAERLGVPPGQVTFAYSANGKPSVPGLEFNVAHSGEVILIATHRCPIGIDVECVDRVIDVAGMGPICFTPRERALATDRDGFLRLWTRKEAWLKAVGTGLSFPLRGIDVTDAAAPKLAPEARVEGAVPSRIVDLPARGYVAACALTEADARVHLWNLPETWHL